MPDYDEMARQLKGGSRLGIAEDTDDWLWVIAHFWPSGGVDLYPALGGPQEPSVEQCIRLIGSNWQAGHRLEPYGPFPVGTQLPRIERE
jgi:hypothetical protein